LICASFNAAHADGKDPYRVGRTPVESATHATSTQASAGKFSIDDPFRTLP
jgi:hypothetical protein